MLRRSSESFDSGIGKLLIKFQYWHNLRLSYKIKTCSVKLLMQVTLLVRDTWRRVTLSVCKQALEQNTFPILVMLHMWSLSWRPCLCRFKFFLFVKDSITQCCVNVNIALFYIASKLDYVSLHFTGCVEKRIRVCCRFSSHLSQGWYKMQDSNH